MYPYQEGQWNEAERAFLQVMETRKTVLGPEHPDTLTSMNNLAITWKATTTTDHASHLLRPPQQTPQQGIRAALGASRAY
jgi:hypothetical protein